MGAILETYLVRPEFTCLLCDRVSTASDITRQIDLGGRGRSLNSHQLGMLALRFEPEAPPGAVEILVEVIRAAGKPYESLPINSNYVADFEAALERAELRDLLWSPRLHAEREERPWCGFLPLSGTEGALRLAAGFREQPGFMEIVDMLEQARWAERDLLTVWT